VLVKISESESVSSNSLSFCFFCFLVDFRLSFPVVAFGSGWVVFRDEEEIVLGFSFLPLLPAVVVGTAFVRGKGKGWSGERRSCVVSRLVEKL
jgi:hypothetical protein